MSIANKIAELSKIMADKKISSIHESDRVDLPDIISDCTLGKPVCDKEYSEEIEYIDINLIVCKVWSKQKIKDNMLNIISFDDVIPIDYNKLQKNGNKFKLSDGNHRVYVCKKLGYSHYPFIKISTSS